MKPNHAINPDSGMRRALVAPLFTAGYGERYAARAKDEATRTLKRDVVRFLGLRAGV